MSNPIKLRYRLEKFEKALVFQVLEMDERFRARTTHISHRALNGLMTVASNGYPQLFSDEIYLRGENTVRDLDLSMMTFADTPSRDTAYRRITTSLSEWADNWPGFTKPALPPPLVGEAHPSEFILK